MAQVYDTYKDSGIQWIGKIPSHWTPCTVRTFAQEYTEKNKPEKTRELLALSYALGVTLYRDKQFNMDRVKEDYEEYKIVHENDLVLSPNDIIKGSVYVSKYYGCISPMYLIFKSRFEDKNYLLYLSYLLRTQQAGRKFFSIAKGLIGSILDNGKYVTRRMSVSRYDLLTFKVVMPPIDEQSKIVSFLDDKCSKIDKWIAKKQEEVELLGELKQRMIANAVTRGINQSVEIKHTNIAWLPEIPAHWEQRKIKYVFGERSEKNHPDEPMLSATQSEGVILQSKYSGRVVVVNTGFEGLKFVKVGDFVIHLRSFQGGIEIAHDQGIISSAYTILSPNYPEYSDYYKYLFKCSPFIDLLKTCVTGIREGQNINYSKLKQNFVPVPPLSEQRLIVSYISNKSVKIDNLIENINKEIESIREYKQRLISDVVTGQIKVC